MVLDHLKPGWHGTCERTKTEQGGQSGLLHLLPLPSRRGGVIGVDRIGGLPNPRGPPCSVLMRWQV